MDADPFEIGGAVENTVDFKVDLVATTPDGSCKLLLVEMGPWPKTEETQSLQRLGQRVGDCITAVIHGVIAERYPRLAGAPVRIQVDSYSTPRWAVEALLAKLQNTVNTDAEIQRELNSGRFTSSILITHRWLDFDEELAKREAKKRGLWQRLKNVVRQK